MQKQKNNCIEQIVLIVISNGAILEPYTKGSHYTLWVVLLFCFCTSEIISNMMNIDKSFFRRLVMLFVVVVGVFLPQSIVAQTVKGRVTDAITGETLVGAAVRVMELPLTGVATDADGEFSITVSQSGRYTIETTYVGYEPSVMKEVLVAGAKEVVLDITLRENSTELAEVEKNK